ncbi:anthrax toxin receptor-like [Meriones unguiculatus]|uniref:anthrax toxin receptor-like n=1 Tax=Meriones unguiculatus TaxID=10047 RepID=UPI00293E3E8C|nr:anthrax toxin receptor-like [Meriones unguiculatus]
MQDYGPQVSCSLHLLLLLLLLLTSLAAVQSFPYPQSGRNPYSRESASFQSNEEWKNGRDIADYDDDDVLQYCDGDFDIYYIYDKSSAVTMWSDLYTAWEDMVEKYVNPNQRMSFILFDDNAIVLMPLTSNSIDGGKSVQEFDAGLALSACLTSPFFNFRTEFREELSRAQTFNESGSTILHKALAEANYQIQAANSGGKTRSSLIIVVVWGILSPNEIIESTKEADKARSMGAYVYCVGMNFYDKSKLNKIADEEENIFIVEGPSSDLHGLVDLIGTMTCLELRYVEPSPLCINETHPLVLRGYGFHNAKDLTEVTCRFKFSNTNIIKITPTDLNSTVIICPRPKIQQSGQTILVDVSLNNERDFLAHTIPVNTSDCPQAPNRPQAPISPGPCQPSPVSPLKNLRKEALLSSMALTLMMIPLLLWWVWWLCCRKPPKALPAYAPEPKPREEETPPVSPPPPAPPVDTSPIVVICSCGCCHDVRVSECPEEQCPNLNLPSFLSSEVSSSPPGPEYLFVHSCSQCSHHPNSCSRTLP